MTITSPDPVAELSALVRSPARPAGGIHILRDGEAAFPAMLELIDGARRAVRFENFIFANDKTGRWYLRRQQCQHRQQ